MRPSQTPQGFPRETRIHHRLHRAPICIIAPISSWAAAVNSYVPADAGISGFQLFLRTIPYNLYAILTIAMVFYICYTRL